MYRLPQAIAEFYHVLLAGQLYRLPLEAGRVEGGVESDSQLLAGHGGGGGDVRRDTGAGVLVSGGVLLHLPGVEQ